MQKSLRFSSTFKISVHDVLLMKHLSFWIDTLAGSKRMKETSPLNLILQMTVLKETSGRKYPRDSHPLYYIIKRLVVLIASMRYF